MGFLDDIGEFIGGIAEIPGDMVEAAASLFDGPGGVVGIFVSGTTLFVGGAGALIPAMVAGVGVTEGINALIKTRTMSPEERVLAEMVFGNTLPPNERIILTNLIGLGGRAFVAPNAAGECLVNLGDDFDDPIRTKDSREPITKDSRELGQLLIHELTHVWQIHHSSFVPGLVCQGIVNQVGYELGGDVYQPGSGANAWSTYNLEQQATIVELWYRGTSHGFGPCSPQHPFYRHVVHINGGTPPPAVQTLKVREVARRKFGLTGAFYVRSRFPSNVTNRYSLRRRVIGLRG